MWNLQKNNKLLNIIKKKSRLTDKETKLVVTSGEREEARGKMGVRD